MNSPISERIIFFGQTPRIAVIHTKLNSTTKIPPKKKAFLEFFSDPEYSTIEGTTIWPPTSAARNIGIAPTIEKREGTVNETFLNDTCGAKIPIMVIKSKILKKKKSLFPISSH